VLPAPAQTRPTLDPAHPANAPASPHQPLEYFHSLPSRKNNGQLSARWSSCYFHRHQPAADRHFFTHMHFASSQPLTGQRAPLLSPYLPPDIQRSHRYSMLLAKFPSPQPAGLKGIQQLLCFG